jgi:3-hydroxyisobutyrate dehydrogenase
MAQSIGFVGVGRMGSNMARRLKECGYPVVAVYDARRETAEALAKELECRAANTLQEVTESADVVITVVTDDAAMKKIFSTSAKGDSLLRGARGKVFINCATVSPEAQIEAAKAAKKAGAEALEGCMAASITQARQGTLYLMCGGDQNTFEQIKPLLEKLSSNLRYVGPSGQAARVKLLVNMVMNMNTAALAEGLALADSLKLDLPMVREVFSQTGAASRVLQTDGEDMQNRDHSCFFSGAHAAKDSTLALNLAKKQGLELPLATATKKQYDRMVNVGIGELDKSGIAELTFKSRAKKYRGKR